ncbi:hypothetical protein [Alteromonas sp. C1M14]|uniref:hypothetical protein n=1 Tax=Alteromonas sp. C1M14 TaxID=2841567 RepID=UPI001C0916D3|nr:hypothetical protein [Alteromonas sp. C1M14]MBU2979982.1 hypothetical protein [Alteromonas sp. C1M14]
MSTYSLSHQSIKPTIVKYTVVLMLLAAVGTSFLYEWHDLSHALQSDNHCSLCVTHDDHDNLLPFSFPSTTATSLAEITIELAATRHSPLFIRSSGNRDPPLPA